MFTTAFTDLSTGNPTSWLWEAKQDDGEWFAFNEYNTGVTFEFEDFHVGVHSIRLTVTNAHGSDTMTKMNYITVNDVP